MVFRVDFNEVEQLENGRFRSGVVLKDSVEGARSIGIEVGGEVRQPMVLMPGSLFLGRLTKGDVVLRRRP